MPIVNGHGAGAGRPHPEVPKASEVAVGVPAAVRSADGRFLPGPGTQALGRKAKQAAIANRIGLPRFLDKWATAEQLKPFLTNAEAWCQEHLESLANDCGGGELSPGVVSIVQSAAQQKAHADFLFDLSTRDRWAWTVEEQLAPTAGEKPVRHPVPRTDIIMIASNLANASRQNLIAARDMAARDAEARAKRPQTYDPLAVEDDEDEDQK